MLVLLLQGGTSDGELEDNEAAEECLTEDSTGTGSSLPSTEVVGGGDSDAGTAGGIAIGGMMVGFASLPDAASLRQDSSGVWLAVSDALELIERQGELCLPAGQCG